MEKIKFTGKVLEEVIKEAEKHFGCPQEQLIIQEIESKSGFFKAKKVEIEAISHQLVIEEIKDFLLKITALMNLEIKLEVKNRDNISTITIFSDNNNILIGKQGRTIEAITTITKQYIQNELGSKFNFVIDVSEYKLKNKKRLERLAKSIAKEVINTKIEVKLEPMNAYERRIIHTTLSEYDKVITESVGEAPNRCVVVKLKESK